MDRFTLFLSKSSRIKFSSLDFDNLLPGCLIYCVRDLKAHWEQTDTGVDDQ